MIKTSQTYRRSHFVACVGLGYLSRQRSRWRAGAREWLACLVPEDPSLGIAGEVGCLAAQANRCYQNVNNSPTKKFYLPRPTEVWIILIRIQTVDELSG